MLFSDKEININRQYNLDLLKSFAIICMIVCHAVLQLAQHLEGYENDFPYIFGDSILGSYAAVAHAFMFSMGFGFIYSRNNSPSALLKRGIKIYFLGYILNFLRYTIYILIEGIFITGEFRSELAYSFFCQDILQFAGLAMIVTALLKKFNFNELMILIISIIMSCIGSFTAFTDTGNAVLNYLLGTFITTTPETSCFTLFNWYIFVAFGMFLAFCIRRIKNLDSFYRMLLSSSAAVMTVYIVLTVSKGMFFLTKNNWYYSTSILEDAELLSIDMTLLSLFYFLLKAVSSEKLKLFVFMSRKVNQIYMIHWCLLGFIDCILCYLLEIKFSYLEIYLIGFFLIAISVFISWLQDNIRGRNNGNKKTC